MGFKIFDWGLIDYSAALSSQKQVFCQVKNKELSSAIILCQHPPVITLGRTAKRENILASSEKLNILKIRVYETQRGGDVTYHGPGQLCIYPIVNLNYLKKDINWYLRSLEYIIINVLIEFGVHAQTLYGKTGVWVKDQKIASIGVTIKNWITFHGISLNIKENDLDNFRLIRACGQDIIITALERIVGQEVKVTKVKELVIKKALGCFCLKIPLKETA